MFFEPNSEIFKEPFQYLTNFKYLIYRTFKLITNIAKEML